MIGGALALGLAGLAVLPIVAEHRRAPIDDQLRRQAPGYFAGLPLGQTHYQWFGPEDGPVVVCIHGLTTPSFVWGGVIPDLVAMGFRVLSYDHYGRGYSDRPRGVQDAKFFTDHLSALLNHLGVTEKVTLLGYSMGGAISAAWAAANPDRVQQVILLAPAGMGHDLGVTAKMVTYVPGLGDWLFHIAYPRSFRAGVEAEDTRTSSVPEINSLQLAELTRRGFLPAVLSSLRGILGTHVEQAHRDLYRAGLPVLAVWGREDSVIPLACKDTLAQWNPNTKHVVIDGAGHGVTYTHTPDVCAAIHDATQS